MIFRAALVALTFTVAAPLAAQPTVTSFFDGDLPGAPTWDISTVTFGNGGTATSTLLPADGNPDACRQIDIDINNAPINMRSGVLSVHVNTSATYDPAVDGQIDLVCYSVWGNEGEKGVVARMRVSPVVRQNGALYITRLGAFVGDSAIDGWTFFSDVNTQDQFVEVDPSDSLDGLDLDSHPDFSSDGSSIEFGFAARNNTGISGGGAMRSVRIDNWQLTLISGVCDDPCPGDLNGDGVVGSEDLAILLAAWGTNCL